MELKGKYVIALGERDAIQAASIAKAAQSGGAVEVYPITSCFV